MHRKTGIVMLAVLIAAVIAASIALAAAGKRPMPPARATQSFRAQLSGKQVVPPVTTKAEGLAVFHLSQDGTKLRYKLTVSNIENVTFAHIHLAAPGRNGPPVVGLYPESPERKPVTGKFTGTLAQGTITAKQLTGPLARKTLKDLVAEMKAGKTYVNVHTRKYPDGEIRGEIKPAK
jgi:hypothetical protein